MHTEALIATDFTVSAILLITLVGLLNRKEKHKSNQAFGMTIIALVVCCILDALSYLIHGDNFSNLFILSISVFSYSFGFVTLSLFTYYWYIFITEKTKLNKLFLIIPIVIFAVTFVSCIFVGYQRKIVDVIDGQYFVTGGLPLFATIVTFVGMIYFPVVAFIKRKDIGLKSVVFLGLFNVLPLTGAFLSLVLGVLDYCYALGGLSCCIVYMFLQNQRNTERDLEHSVEIQKKNIELEELVKNQEMSLNIVSSLSKSFVCIYYVDLDDESFVELSQTNFNDIKNHIGSNGNAREKFVEMSKYLVQPEYAKEALEFIELSTVADRLKDVDFIEFVFKGIPQVGWCNGSFIAAKREENGRVTKVLWAIKTINEQKLKDEKLQTELFEAKEKAESANKAKSTFLFNMSHDIRTPMNAILGFVQLMFKDLNNPEKLKSHLSKVDRSSRFLLDVLNNVLDIARIESGKATLNEDVMDIMGDSMTIDTIFIGEIQRKNITFIPSMNIQHHFVLADAKKLQQIMVNLLSNSIKYTPDNGTIWLDFSEAPSEKEGYGTFITTVKDNGIGMSKEFQEHLFETFSRERNSTESKIQGTGLGLAIVKSIVDLMGGKIEVESEVGKGTTFRITNYHKLLTEEDMVKSHSVSSEKKENNIKGKRVLVAEDNALNAEIATAILEDAGFQVELAKDGVECLEKLNTSAPHYYDAILMDIQMPNLNGYDATKHIRLLQDTAKANIPIIAMTANAFDEDKKAAIDAGMNDHISKPINIEILVETISHYI